MSDDQDWRLQVDIADPSALHEKLRGAHHFERELDPLIPDHVVLSHDDDTVFAYANTRGEIDEVRRAVEHQLSKDGLSAQLHVTHWDDPSGAWLAPGEAPPATESAPAADPIVTRTFVETSGRIVRNAFESAVAEAAHAQGVELSIVEHPHLLTTQLAFTLHGPASAVNAVIAESQGDAANITRFEVASII